MTVLRNDEQWLNDLISNDSAVQASAVSDLRNMLLRGLSKSLSKHGRVDDAFLEDIVQESSVKVLENLSTFQGRSKFRTWAVTIAVRTAISQMRKREWQNVSLDRLTADLDFNPEWVANESETAETRSQRASLFNTLQELIDSKLTTKQWTAITAELRGMPLSQVAEKLDSNPNSVYKLLHDARKKLRRGLEAAGFTIDDVRSALP